MSELGTYADADLSVQRPRIGGARIDAEDINDDPALLGTLEALVADPDAVTGPLITPEEEPIIRGLANVVRVYKENQGDTTTA